MMQVYNLFTKSKYYTQVMMIHCTNSLGLPGHNSQLRFEGTGGIVYPSIQ